MRAYAAAVGCAIFVAAPMARGAISAERILAGLSEPVFVAAAPGDARLFIVLRGGTVRIYDNGQLLVPPFLDISSGVNVSGEGGLLSIAFPPAFTFSPGNYVYAYYSADAVGADNTLALRVQPKCDRRDRRATRRQRSRDKLWLGRPRGHRLHRPEPAKRAPV